MGKRAPQLYICLFAHVYRYLFIYFHGQKGNFPGANRLAQLMGYNSMGKRAPQIYICLFARVYQYLFIYFHGQKGNFSHLYGVENGIKTRNKKSNPD